MASLKDLVKSALDKKNSAQHSDGHDAVTKAEAKLGTAPKTPSSGAKPQKKAAGRGR